ncbi:MAG: hypothetical protein ACI8UO_005314 [Verrucomicrobiales bacterium]|jgi:hypothetical protein
MLGLAWVLESKAQAPAFVPSTAPSPDQQLLPAALGLRTDKRGNSWNFQQSGALGRIGSSMMNTGLELYINNSQFTSTNPLMTQDGKEFVLPGRVSRAFGGLVVSRRVRIDDNLGVVRYLEVFENPSAQPVVMNIELRTNFSGNYKSYVTNSGTPNATVLGRADTGVVVTPSASNQRHAFVFNFCSAEAKQKPTLTSQSRYVLGVHHQLRVPAGETVCVVHTVSQIPNPASLDRKVLSDLFRPLSLSRHLSSIPRSLRDKIANFSLGQESAGLALLSATSIDSLGVKRGRRDVLAVGEATRLVGSTNSGKLSVESDFGPAEIEWEDVAAIVGGNRGRRDRGKIFLRDGQVLGGKIDAEALRFVLQSGNVMDLEIAKLDRLVRSQDPDNEAWPEGVVAFLETHSGDRIALENSEDSKLKLVSPWGEVEVGIEDVRAVATQEQEPVGHFVELKNGSRFFAYLGGESFAFKNSRFGNRSIHPAEIRAVVSRQAASPPAGGSSQQLLGLTQPYLTLRGQQRLVSRVLDPSLTLLTDTESLSVSPENVRHLLNLAEDLEFDPNPEPVFRAELWGGGVVVGQVRERTITIDPGWKIPVGDIHQIVVPTPRITDEARKQIGQRIRKLGDNDWSTREQATEELAEFGFLAKPQLLESLQSNDAEVRRRVELLLARLE